jgi:UDP-N-acetylmuramoyl-L-alanyl-D-glutamate--2,6-diaminopimelate ligase
LTYGLQPGVTVSAREVEKSFQGLRGLLRIARDEVPFSSALIGEPHLYNILAASTIAHALGVPPEVIVAGIARCSGVPGRLEAIAVGQPFGVLVDYAHKPDAIEKTLRSVRQLTGGRLLTVFGCGGDRDRGKRPLMGAIAARLSDIAVLTSDNPRSEDPLAILSEIEAGVKKAGMEKSSVSSPALGVVQRETRDPGPETERSYYVEPDRRAAIRLALGLARRGDLVLIAGKGHEDYQILGSGRIHFDDREVARTEASRRAAG